VVAREVPSAEVLCLDLNPEVLETGRRGAAEEGLRVEFGLADLNTAVLPEGRFDVVVCHASLHHVLELERLAAQIRKALRPGGELVVLDIVTRNGYRMWPETRRLVGAIWATLPERLRLNHTAYPEKRVDRKVWESDTRSGGMECLRSQDILPVLRNSFETVQYVPHFAICRRFFDTMYGPNYDLTRPLDRAIVDWIWELDREALVSGQLRPETFFGVFR
jgi:SAM-dependent methyltransferase